MREILFKAKRIGNGEWVEGWLIKGKWYFDESEIFAILPTDLCIYPRCEFSECIEIDKDTICQYTGLTDKNGNKIWENDRIGHRLNVVEFLNGEWCVNGDIPLFFYAKDSEVIGNAFDNPELMKGE